MSDEFEKYWQQQFESFEVEPNNNLWHRLDNALFEKQSQSLFKQYIVNPDNRVWRNIVVALWWKKFVKFSPTYFNIYYFFFSILIVGSIIFYKSNGNFYSENSNNHFSENTINTPRDIRHIFTKSDFYSEKPLFAIKAKNIIVNKPKQTISISHFEKEKTMADQLASLQMCKNILYSNDITENFSDREVKEYKRNNNVNLGISLGYVWPQHQLKLLPLKEKQYDPYFDLLTTQAFSAAIWFQYSFNAFDFETGLMFQSIKQRYSYNNPIISNDTIINMHINDLSYYQYSTIQIINLDTLLQTGDTVWINYTDSTLIAVFDTTYQTEINEMKIDRRALHYFSYKTFEIPFMLTYTQHLDRFNVHFKAGISVAYTVATQGTLPSFSGMYGNIPIKNSYFKSIYLNSLAAIELQYWINEHWSVSFVPMYKHTLTSITTSEIPMSLKTQSWVVFMSLKYRIR